MLQLSDEAANWLKVAGRIIQNKAVSNIFYRKIVRKDNESYPLAVLREVNSLDAELQSKLFDVVDWSEEFQASQNEMQIAHP